MSIVNDALKKASKESEFRNQNIMSSVQKIAPASDKKWIVAITASIVIILSLFGSLILYKNMPRFNPRYALSRSTNLASTIESTLNNAQQKTAARAIKPGDIVKLNGIVYGTEDKWAIVNDRIVKEGDSLLGGEITSITEDLVTIEKNDGTKVVLSLKY